MQAPFQEPKLKRSRKRKRLLRVKSQGEGAFVGSPRFSSTWDEAFTHSADLTILLTTKHCNHLLRLFLARQLIPPGQGLGHS